jgi:ornithine cyclodeaminase/alanine dehydrogenase-like protein (mu-crystallin family)
VHADLGQLAAGRRSGRRTTDEIIVFDSTGTALQDVAAAALVHERARAAGVGSAMEMAS